MKAWIYSILLNLQLLKNIKEGGGQDGLKIIFITEQYKQTNGHMRAIKCNCSNANKKKHFKWGIFWQNTLDFHSLFFPLVGSFWRSDEANGCERWRRHQLQTLLGPDPELGHNPAWSAQQREVVQMHLPFTMSRRLQLHLPLRSGVSASLHLSRTTHLQTKH